MGKIIKDLPNEIDPIVLIKKKKLTCPYCGTDNIHDWYGIQEQKMDKKGKHHKLFIFKNKYVWNRYPDITCHECGCEYDTGWFPVDHKMFEVEINDEQDWDKVFEEFAKI